MKKIILRITLAAGLVCVANWAMNSDNKANASEKSSKPLVAVIQSADPEDLYELVEEHPDHELGQVTRQFIEDENLCPDGPQICANPVDASNSPIQWTGATSKF